jgi:hypothetical protein
MDDIDSQLDCPTFILNSSGSFLVECALEDFCQVEGKYDLDYK